MKTTMFVWQIARLPKPQEFRDWCIKHGISRVIIKVADAVYSVNQVREDSGTPQDWPLLELKSVLEAAGIELGGFHYVYGNVPQQEAFKSAERIRTLGLKTFVVDAEGEWERLSSPVQAATVYMTELRKQIPNTVCKIALSSFRFKKGYHDAFPFDAFMHNGMNEMWPQVYWVGAHNAGQQLQRSYDEMSALYGKIIVPVGAMYCEGTFEPTVEEMRDFFNRAKQIGLSDIAWWAYDDKGLSTHPEWATFLESVKEVPVPVSPPPPAIQLSQEEILKRLVTAHPDLFPELFNGKKIVFPLYFPFVSNT